MLYLQVYTLIIISLRARMFEQKINLEWCTNDIHPPLSDSTLDEDI
jgi:hypothetical protein